MLPPQMRRRTKAQILAAAGMVAAATGLQSHPARAQGTGTDKAAAEALFDEAKRLYLDKKFTEACPRFEASERIDPGIGTLLYLADCYESVGRIASAWATFREAASTAKANGQGEREEVARQRAALLEPKLHRLTLLIESKSAPPGLKVQRNDVEVKPEAFNLALPVDPGPTTVSATAPGKKPWSTHLEVPAGPGAQTLAVPALEDDPNARAPVAATLPAAPPPEVPVRGHGQRVAGVVVGSIGLAVLAVSGALVGVAASTNASAKAACPLVPCSNMTGIDQANQAGTLADGATVTLLFGGAALVAGAALFFSAPRAAKAPPVKNGWVAPSFGPGTAGLAAGWTFQ